MKNRFDRLQRFKLLPLLTIVAALVALGVGGVAWAQGGRGTDHPTSAAFRGKVHIAANSYDGSSTLTIPGTGVQTTVESVAFTIPSGKVGELTASANAWGYWPGSTGGTCNGEFRLDTPTTGTLLHPGQMPLMDGYVYKNGLTEGLNMQGFTDVSAISAGAHTLYFVMLGTGDGCTIYQDSLIVQYTFHLP